MWIHEVDPLSLDAIADMSPPQLSPELIQAIAQTLRSAREKRGDGHGEIALRIALTSSQLKAIEAGNLLPFYSPSYFLQAAQRYADFLGTALPTVEPANAVDTHTAAATEGSLEPPIPADPPAISETPPVAEITTAAELPTDHQQPRADVETPPSPEATAIAEPYQPPAEPLPAVASSESIAAAQPAEDHISSAANTIAPTVAPTVAPSSMPVVRPGTVRAEVSEDQRAVPWGWILLAVAALIVAFVAATSLRKPTPVPAATETPPANQESAPATPPADGGNATGTPASPSAPAPAPSSSPASQAQPAGKPAAAPSSPPSATTPASPATPSTKPAAPSTPAASPASPAQQPAPAAPAAPANKSQAPGVPSTPASGLAPPAAPAPSSTTPSSTAPAPSPTTRTSPASDSQFETQAGTWVQIVRANGEKVNLKVEPGQKIDFAADSTAAIVFGQPEKASLRVKGKPVNLGPFLTGDSPPRALVIISQIRE